MDIKDKLKTSLLSDYLHRLNGAEPDWDYIGAFIARRLELLSDVLALEADEDIKAREAGRLAAGVCHPVIKIERTFESFERSVHGLVKRLWNGNLDKYSFVDGMVGAITRGFHQAWLEGAAQCGVEESELTERELLALKEATNEQFQYLPGFADAIIDSRDNGEPGLEAMLSRSEMWVARYRDTKAKAAAMACADQKATWALGGTQDHCRSCAGFRGRVYRYSIWLKNGAIPGAHRLCCKGFRCLCILEPASGKANRGAFPRGMLCGGGARSILAKVREALDV